MKANTMTVETLAPQESDENYLKTYHFYEKTGFIPLLNLKPQDYEWNMVYMVKFLSKTNATCIENIEIKALHSSYIPEMVNAFAKINWNKPASIFENYLQEQENGERLIWVAFIDNQFVGFVTVKWQYQKLWI
jgi:hypothetical protein